MQLHTFLSSLDLSTISQVELEQQSHDYKSQAVKEMIEQSQAKTAASDSVIGRSVTATHIKTLGDQIAKGLPQWISRTHRKTPFLDSVYSFLTIINDEDDESFAYTLANLTLTHVFNACFSNFDTKFYNLVIPAVRKNAKNKYELVELSSACEFANLASEIGSALQVVAQLRAIDSLRDSNPDAFWTAVRKHKSALQVGTDYAKSKFIESAISSGFTWTAWSHKTVVQLGHFFLAQVLKAFWQDKLFQHRTSWSDGQPDKALFVASDKLTQDAVILEEAAQFNARVKLPLIEQPQPWCNENEFFGGYHTNELLQLDKLVRRRDNLTPSVGKNPLASLNNLQNVGFIVNSFVLDVAHAVKAPLVDWVASRNAELVAAAEEKGVYARKLNIKIDNFIPAVQGQSAAKAKKTYRTETVLAVADAFKDVTFYHAWNFDYRGRMYPLTSVLHHQSTGFEKSLLKFADVAPVTDSAIYWLKVQVANAFGLDKKSFAERIAWVNDNAETISAVATAPVDNFLLWKDVDSPWEFLAACEEYHACVIAKTRTTTNLPVAVDATCSGIQILSGITKDADSAHLVNVLPCEEKQDAYGAVAAKAKEMLMSSEPLPKVPSAKSGKPKSRTSFDTHVLLTRSVAKKVVMTVPYNATSQSNKEAVKSALVDALQDSVADGAEFKFPSSPEIDELVHALRVAVELVLPGPLAFRDWLNTASKAKATQLNGQALEWTTPSGFQVLQFKNKPLTERMQSTIGGLTADITLVVGWTKETAVGTHGTCTAPNLIHSLDASILHIAFGQCEVPFSLIHDSVLCSAADMDAIQSAVRDAYAYIFCEHDIPKHLQSILGADAPFEAPANQFDPSVVKQSLYFFS